MNELVDYLRGASNILIFTGVGIFTRSSIQDYHTRILVIET